MSRTDCGLTITGLMKATSNDEELDKQKMGKNKKTEFHLVPTPSLIPLSTASPTIAPIPLKTLFQACPFASPPTPDAPMPAKSPSPDDHTHFSTDFWQLSCSKQHSQK